MSPYSFDSIHFEHGRLFVKVRSLDADVNFEVEIDPMELFKQAVQKANLEKTAGRLDEINERLDRR